MIPGSKTSVQILAIRATRTHSTPSRNGGNADLGALAKRDRSSLPSPWWWLPLLTLSGVLVLAGLVLTWEGGVLWGKHGDAVEDWSQEVSHLSLEVADSVSASLAAVDAQIDRHLLPTAQAVALRPSAAPQAMANLQDRAERLRLVRVVAVFGAAGELILSSDPILRRKGVSVEDRDFFQLMHFNGAASFTTVAHLGPPAVEGEAQRLYILSIRGLRDTQGLFAGILVVAIDPEILLRSRLDFPVLQNSEIRLFDETGKLITIPPSGSNAVGTRYGDGALFKLEAAEGLPQVGILPNPFDGTPEIAALRRVGTTRILASVKVDGGPELTQWWHAVAGCLVGAAVLFGTAGWLAWRGTGMAEWFAGPVGATGSVEDRDG